MAFYILDFHLTIIIKLPVALWFKLELYCSETHIKIVIAMWIIMGFVDGELYGTSTLVGYFIPTPIFRYIRFVSEYIVDNFTLKRVYTFQMFSRSWIISSNFI